MKTSFKVVYPLCSLYSWLYPNLVRCIPNTISTWYSSEATLNYPHYIWLILQVQLLASPWYSMIPHKAPYKSKDGCYISPHIHRKSPILCHYKPMIYRGFLKCGYPSYHPFLDWILHWNKPSRYWGSPIYGNLPHNIICIYIYIYIIPSFTSIN